MADPVSNEAFTLLQYAIGIGTAAGAALAAFFGVRAKTRRRDDVHSISPNIQWYFDGPIVKALDLFDGIYREIKQLRADQQRHADDNNKKDDEQIGLLRDAKERLRDLDLRSPRSTRRD